MPSIVEATRLWLRVGLLSFGGPAGQIALMHRELVQQRQWIAEQDFLGLLNISMLLPGPEAQQLATAIGWRLHGVPGGLIAGTLFVLPGVLVILALSMLYLAFGQLPLAGGIFLGLRAAVLAIVLHALIRLSRRLLGAWPLEAMAMLAFLAVGIFGLPFPLMLLAAGLAGMVLALAGLVAPPRADGPVALSGAPAAASAPWRAAAVVALLWAGLLVALWLSLGRGHVFTQVGLFFSKMAMVTFGGAYAVLAWVAQEAVEGFGWLSPSEMIDGLALAETTPGPLILVVQFVAFLAGARGDTGLPPMLAGTLASLVALMVTFLPCFLWIFLAAPQADQLLASRRLSGALAGITAAVVGVIASLALWFAIHSLFGAVRQVPGLAVPIPVLPSIQWPALGLTLMAIIAVLRFHVGPILLLPGAALAGIALQTLGPG